MKKILLAVAICFIFTMGVAANSGSAVIPGYLNGKTASHFQCFVMHVSNITPDPIDVEIILYRRDGSLLNNVSSYVTVVNAFNFDGSATENTFQFSLGGNHTCGITFDKWPELGEIGYGIIKWNQNSTAVHGLVARGYNVIIINNNHARSSISINGGQPF